MRCGHGLCIAAGRRCVQAAAPAGAAFGRWTTQAGPIPSALFVAESPERLADMAGICLANDDGAAVAGQRLCGDRAQCLWQAAVLGADQPGSGVIVGSTERRSVLAGQPGGAARECQAGQCAADDSGAGCVPSEGAVVQRPDRLVEDCAQPGNHRPVHCPRTTGGAVDGQCRQAVRHPDHRSEDVAGFVRAVQAGMAAGAKRSEQQRQDGGAGNGPEMATPVHDQSGYRIYRQPHLPA